MPAATSSAVTSRPMGCRAFRAARSAAGSPAWSSSRPTQGVSAVPGFTQLTRVPSGVWSAAIPGVRAPTPPFVAEYSPPRRTPPLAAPPPARPARGPPSSAVSRLLFLSWRPPGRASGRRDEALLGPAETVDLQPHDVARPQVRVVGQAERHPGGSAGVDDVAGFEHHVLAQVPDEVSDLEDHVARRAVLPLAAVDLKPQPESLPARHLVGRDEPRPH